MRVLPSNSAMPDCTLDAQTFLQLYHVYHTMYLTEDMKNLTHTTNTTEVLRQKTCEAQVNIPCSMQPHTYCTDHRADMETLLLYHTLCIH